MKTITATLLSLIISAAQAFASSGAAEGEELSLLAIGFISFGVLIVLFQFVPALLLIGGMVAGLFKAGEKKNEKELARADKEA
ncbi:MAG: hypothetical protein H7Y05_13345 [Steroidobacteraceae bacterium]|nr:hypothetical protein [Deltaproteobacteria bacterium]